MNFKEVETQYMIEMESYIMKEKNIVKWICKYLKFKIIYFLKILANSLSSIHKGNYNNYIVRKYYYFIIIF